MVGSQNLNTFAVGMKWLMEELLMSSGEANIWGSNGHQDLTMESVLVR